MLRLLDTILARLHVRSSAVRGRQAYRLLLELVVSDGRALERAVGDQTR